MEGLIKPSSEAEDLQKVKIEERKPSDKAKVLYFAIKAMAAIKLTKNDC